MPRTTRRIVEEEEKHEMSCEEDPLLDEMLMKAERLRLAMLVAANPIPDTIETRHGDNMTECSSVGYSTVFSKMLRTDHSIAKKTTPKKVEESAAPTTTATATFRDTNSVHSSRRPILGVTTEEEEEKTVEEEDFVDTPTSEDVDDDVSVDDDDHHFSPIALSAPDLDANSVVAIQLASEWQGVTTAATSRRTIARKGDADFSPVADYSSRRNSPTVTWEKVTLAQEHDDDYVPMKDYSPTAVKSASKSRLVAPPLAEYNLGPLGTFRLQRPLRKNRRRRILWMGTFVVAIAASLWLQNACRIEVKHQATLDYASQTETDMTLCMVELDFEQLMIDEAKNRALQLDAASLVQPFSRGCLLPKFLAPLCNYQAIWNSAPQEKQQMVEEFLMYSFL